MANYSRFPPEIKENPVLVCTAWVHGIHPGRLSYFTDNLWKLIVEIDVGGLRGHEKVGIREEEEADFGVSSLLVLPIGGCPESRSKRESDNLVLLESMKLEPITLPAAAVFLLENATIF